ncbi:unnamed protein product [Prunus armeniaca]
MKRPIAPYRLNPNSPQPNLPYVRGPKDDNYFMTTIAASTSQNKIAKKNHEGKKKKGLGKGMRIEGNWVVG